MDIQAGNIASRREPAQLRARAVWLYHVEGRTQNEIADMLSVNRVAVVRMLADAKLRNEVRITVTAPLIEMVELERLLEQRWGIERVIVAPFSGEDDDPTKVISAAAGNAINGMVHPNMTVGVGWGRTLYNSLPFIVGTTLENFRVVSLLGGIAAARRFNPAEFAWQFADMFQGEGYLVPAPAVVDSPDTKHALLERCGLASIFEMAGALDAVFVSVGGISQLTTSYRTGYLTEADRRSLIDAGAVGDVLYNFIDADGRVIDHEVNRRIISADLDVLARCEEKVLISGGRDKLLSIKAAIRNLRPTTLITDEATARSLMTLPL